MPGAVTIATNMAGRGTDIQLGGNADMRVVHELADMPEGPEREEKEKAIRAEVERLKAAGAGARRRRPLHHRHRAPREPAHRQPASRPLRPPGRPRLVALLPVAAGRPDAHLLAERMDGMLQKLGLKEDEAIVHPWINRALEKAQQKVEARNFDIRKNLLKFDDVMNDQRRVIFEQRIDLMGQETVTETVADMRHEIIEDLVARHIPEKAYPEQWDANGLREAIQQTLNLDLPIDDWAKEEGIADDEVRERIIRAADEQAAQRAVRFGPEIMRQVEKAVLLQTLDHLWREHLATLDHLRQVVGFRGYAQRDPLNEYKTESFELFQSLLVRLREVGDQPADARRDRPASAAARPGRRLRRHGGDPPRSADRRERDGRDRRSGRRRGDARAMAVSPPPRSTRTIPRPGARSSATRPAPAAPARNTSTATAGSSDGDAGNGRLLVVVNPNASRAEQSLGRGDRARFLPEGFALDLRQCGGRDEVRASDQAEAGGVDAIVIGGGDGTVSGALSGLVESNLPVGILPLGTANDLARTLGIPVDPVEAAAVIAGGYLRKIDVGRVNDIDFLNVASIGLAVEITDRLDPDLKRRLGPLSYAAAALSTLGSAEHFAATIECGGSRADVSAYQITVGNGVHYGGGARVATDAAIDDGNLDIFAIETASIPELVAMAPAFFEGRHGERDDVRVFRGPEALIETATPMPVSTDGEITTETPARFSVARGALSVFAPR